MAKDWKKIIPEKFWHGDHTVKAATVGTLIDRLQELPRDMRLGETVTITVYNIGDSSRHVGIAEDW